MPALNAPSPSTTCRYTHARDKEEAAGEQMRNESLSLMKDTGRCAHTGDAHLSHHHDTQVRKHTQLHPKPPVFLVKLEDVLCGGRRVFIVCPDRAPWRSVP